MPLFAAGAGLAERARSRLQASWAEWFRREVMPVLLAVEDRFAGLYTEEGRPNWSVARMLGVSLLQHLYDLSDQQALDALSFDVRWQYALGLEAEEAYLSRRSLVGFRRRLVRKDPDGALMREVFDRICTLGLERLEVSKAHQRIDSTLVCSNIRGRGRLSLARETLRVFVRSLDSAGRARLPGAVLSWYDTNDETWEQPESNGDAKARLSEIGAWISDVVAVFQDDEDVRDSEPYRLLCRLLEEHAEAFGIEQAIDDDGDEPPSGSVPDEPKRHKKRREGRKRKRKSRKKGSSGKAPLLVPARP